MYLFNVHLQATFLWTSMSTLSTDKVPNDFMHCFNLLIQCTLLKGCISTPYRHGSFVLMQCFNIWFRRLTDTVAFVWISMLYHLQDCNVISVWFANLYLSGLQCYTYVWFASLYLFMLYSIIAIFVMFTSAFSKFYFRPVISISGLQFYTYLHLLYPIPVYSILLVMTSSAISSSAPQKGNNKKFSIHRNSPLQANRSHSSKVCDDRLSEVLTHLQYP